MLGPFVLLGYPTSIGPGIANVARGEREGLVAVRRGWAPPPSS